MSRERSSLMALRALRALLALLVSLSAVSALSAELRAQDSPDQAIALSLARQEASALPRVALSSARLSWELYAERFGLRLISEWGQASLSNLSWTVTHDELRAQAQALSFTQLGSARLSAALGLGPLWIFERRVRHQAERLGLSGAARETSGARLTLELSGALSLSLPLTERLALLMSLGARYRARPSSTEDPQRSLTQSLGLSWSFP